jgi:hypothetical protein
LPALLILDRFYPLPALGLTSNYDRFSEKVRVRLPAIQENFFFYDERGIATDTLAAVFLIG